MLDVHAPEHRIGGFRDFLIHLLTITVGLLIALGLENAAEAWHHRQQRREAEAEIREELNENRQLLMKAAGPVRAERNNLVQAIRTYRVRSAGKPTDTTKIDLTFNEEPIPDAAWRAAIASGVLAYMPYDQVKRFAAAYQVQTLLEQAEDSAFDDYLQMNPVLDRGETEITPEAATEALPAMHRALGHLNGMLSYGEGTLHAYEDALK